MKRFQVDKDATSLTLTMEIDYWRFAVGGGLFFVAMLCNLVFAALGVWQVDRSGKPMGTLGPFAFFEPQANPFGFLWGVSFVLIVALIPVFALRLRDSAIEYRFDLLSGLLLRNGKELTPLRKVENVQIRRMMDADRGHWYRIVLVYGDGNEIFIDESYDEDEVAALAYDIAGYANTEVVRVSGSRGRAVSGM